MIHCRKTNCVNWIFSDPNGCENILLRNLTRQMINLRKKSSNESKSGSIKVTEAVTSASHGPQRSSQMHCIISMVNVMNSVATS